MSEIYKFNFEDTSVYSNIIKLIPNSGVTKNPTHLDFGCGFGAIAEKMKELQINYIGLDSNQVAVDNLKTRNFYAEKIDLNNITALSERVAQLVRSFAVRSVSLIDVIEHLESPIDFLAALHKCLPDDVTLILSVPNYSHYDIAIKLLAGKWDETTSGILDTTHKQVYTEEKLHKTLSASGWIELSEADYHLELTEQFDQNSILLNRDVGLFELLRETARFINKNHDVYQFVRSYAKAKSTAIPEKIAKTSSYNKKSLAFIVILENPESLIDFQEENKHQNYDVIFITDISNTSIKYTSLNNQCFSSNDSLSIIKELENYKYFIPVTSKKEVSEGYLNILNCILNKLNSSPVIWCHSQALFNEIKIFSLEEISDYPTTLSNNSFLIPTNTLDFFDFSKTQTSFINKLSSLILELSILSGIVAVQHECTPPNFPLSSLEQDKDRYKIYGIPRKLSNILEYCVAMHNNNANLSNELQEIKGSYAWKTITRLRKMRSLRPSHLLAHLARRLYQKSRIFPFLLFSTRVLIRKIYSALWGTVTSHNRNLLATNALTEKRKQISTYTPAKDNALEFDISVVTYNSSHWISPFLKQLCKVNYPLSKVHLYFVDNGSTDNTVETINAELLSFSIREKFASVTLIEQPNLGFGSGHHKGISSGKSEFVLVTNIDLEFEEDTFSQLFSYVNQPKQNDVASWELRQIPYEHPKYYDPVTLETNWSSHACILLRRTAYERIGGYEKRIFMYAEDVELSYRFRSFGYRLQYCPKAVVRHYSYESAGQIKPLQIAGSTLGNAYVRLRYGTWFDKFAILPLYAALLTWPSSYPNSKKDVLKNISKIIKNTPGMLSGKGKTPAYFPFRMFDYEMIREGAFYKVSRSNSQTLVSIIIRTYRGRNRFLREAIRSVLNQTYEKIELIVVEDGGATMQSLVQKETENAPFTFKYISCEKVGRSVTGNRALAATTGTYVMFLDDDDLLFPDHIEVLMSELTTDKSIDAAYSLAVQVYTSQVGEEYKEVHFETPNLFKQIFDYAVLEDHNFMPIQSVLFKRELFLKWGGFEEDMDQLEDWNLWLRYAYGANFKYIPKTTSLFRIPADDNIRSSRHLQLHAAYNMAKERAMSSIKVKMSI